MKKMSIIIDEKHSAKLDEALKDGQGKARERRIENAANLIELVEGYKAEIPDIPKSHWHHCRLIITVGDGHFPGAYKGILMGTQVMIEFGKDGVGRLLDVSRSNVNGAKEFSFTFTRQAKASVLEKLHISAYWDYDEANDCWKPCANN